MQDSLLVQIQNGLVLMVRAVERIEQELALLDQAVATIAHEFHDTYSQYLTVLGQAVRQQLILASYHLCTSGYPERFLNLSLNQRQQLQQSLRQLTKTAQQQILDRLQSVESSKALYDLSRAGAMDDLRNAKLEENLDFEEIALGSVELPSHLFSSDLSDPADPVDPDPSDEQLLDPESPQPELASERVQPDAEPEFPPLEPTQADANSPPSQPALTQSPSTEPSAPAPSEPRPTYPQDLVYWQEQLEEGIVEELQNLSHAANRLLQQTKILPSRLPEPVLEVAAKADIASESAISPPNLLNLLIETEDDEEKESTMTHLMAIRLRLSEIEFSDAASTLWRSKIRDLSTRLNKLGREYQKKQKERSIAQAEAAWRSSWYED